MGSVNLQRGNELRALCRCQRDGEALTDELLLICVVPEHYDAYDFLADYQKAKQVGLLEDLSGLEECADLASLRYYFTGTGRNPFGDERENEEEMDEEDDGENFLLESEIEPSQNQRNHIVLKCKVTYGADIYQIMNQFRKAKDQLFFPSSANLCDGMALESMIVQGEINGHG